MTKLQILADMLEANQIARVKPNDPRLANLERELRAEYGPKVCPVGCRDYNFGGQCKHTYPAA